MNSKKSKEKNRETLEEVLCVCYIRVIYVRGKDLQERKEFLFLVPGKEKETRFGFRVTIVNKRVAIGAGAQSGKQDKEGKSGVEKLLATFDFATRSNTPISPTFFLPPPFSFLHWVNSNSVPANINTIYYFFRARFSSCERRRVLLPPSLPVFPAL